MFRRGVRTRRAFAVLSLALLALAVLSFAPSASAGENGTFGAEPYPAMNDGQVRRSFDLPSGATFADAFRVYNRTREAIRLSLYAAEASVGRDDVLSVGFRGARPTRGLAGRIAIGRPAVQLAPGADIVVPFAVRMRGVAAGAMAAIVIEGTPASGTSVDLVQRIAILVRPSVDGVGNGGRITREHGSPFRAIASVMLMVVGSWWVLVARRRRTVLDGSPQEAGRP